MWLMAMPQIDAQAGATGEGGAGELFALPDGQEICVRKEGLMAGELLFAPPSELVGADVPGLAGAVYNAIVNHHEVSMRRVSPALCPGYDLMSNVKHLHTFGA